MNIEEKAEQLINEFKDKLKVACDDVLGVAYCDILPHAEGDTLGNVNSSCQSVIKRLLAGEFKQTDLKDTVLVEDNSGIGVYIQITDFMYDGIRDNLIKHMPSCPKDLKIKQLQKTIEQLQESFRR